MVDVLSFVHKENLTPAPALIFNVRHTFDFFNHPGNIDVNRNVCLQGLIAAVMVLGGDIESLIDFFSFTVSFFYAMAMLALLVLRKTRPNLNR